MVAPRALVRDRLRAVFLFVVCRALARSLWLRLDALGGAGDFTVGLFSKKSEWEETFRINALTRGGRGFCSVIFWIWGLGGFLLIGSEFMSTPSGVGVGTSSYIAAQSVYWLGGHVSFRTRGTH